MLGLRGGKIPNPISLVLLLAVFCLFIQETNVVLAITEDENEVSLRDAGSTRERPRLDNYDMSQDDEIQINVISYNI